MNCKDFDFTAFKRRMAGLRGLVTEADLPSGQFRLRPPGEADSPPTLLRLELTADGSELNLNLDKSFVVSAAQVEAACTVLNRLNSGTPNGALVYLPRSQRLRWRDSIVLEKRACGEGKLLAVVLPRLLGGIALTERASREILELLLSSETS